MEGGPEHIRSIDEPGLKAPREVVQLLREEVAKLLGRSQLSFPGAQPVSFARCHIEELLREDYFVCEKSDGIRYLLYLTQNEHGEETAYLIDRKNDYWFIDKGNLHFPLPVDERAFHTGTLIDGELVMDEFPDGHREPTFLVFDCLALDGKVLMNRDLRKRLGYITENLYRPYKTLLQTYPEERQFQPFFLGMKDMQLSYGIPVLFEQIIPKLHHGNDGLIFTCIGSHYKPGTDPHILKWKEAEENTIDYKWKLKFPPLDVMSDDDDTTNNGEPCIDYDAVPHVDLLVNMGGGDYRSYATLHLEEDEWEALKGLGEPLDGRIVEAWMDDQKRWRMSRFRDDKNDGNHVSVVNSVVESIRDGVTRQDLMAERDKLRSSWKAREQQNRRG